MKTLFVHKTRGTNLTWWTLEGWVRAANELDARRSCDARNKALEAHTLSLTRSVINAARNPLTIEQALALLKWGPPHLRRPQKGERAGAPHTALIEDLMNRKRMLSREGDIPTGDNWRTMHPDITDPTQAAVARQ